MKESARQVVKKFFELPYPSQMRIMLDLGLLEESDHHRPISETITLAIKRARENNLLEDLRAAITTSWSILEKDELS